MNIWLVVCLGRHVVIIIWDAHVRINQKTNRCIIYSINKGNIVHVNIIQLIQYSTPSDQFKFTKIVSIFKNPIMYAFEVDSEIFLHLIQLSSCHRMKVNWLQNVSLYYMKLFWGCFVSYYLSLIGDYGWSASHICFRYMGSSAYRLDFQSAKDSPLEIGTYEKASSFHITSNPIVDHNSFLLTGEHKGCLNIDAQFQIEEVSWKKKEFTQIVGRRKKKYIIDVVDRFKARFEQSCQDGTYPTKLSGVVRYDSRYE